MKIYKIDQHDQLLHLWRELGLRNLHVVHVDFHCDMRGLLVDIDRQVGWRIPEVRQTLDEGNFLRYAIFEGNVAGVSWVHGTPGGRLYDVHTVKYTSDLSALPYRRLQRSQVPQPLRYEELEMQHWQGVCDGDFLDVDWDTFADRSLPAEQIERRVEAFLAKPLDSQLSGVSVCYSPHHSHPTRERYDRFVESLAERFSAEIETRVYQQGSNELPWRMKLIPKPIYDNLQAVYHGGRLALKRCGIQ